MINFCRNLLLVILEIGGDVAGHTCTNTCMYLQGLRIRAMIHVSHLLVVMQKPEFSYPVVVFM